MVEKEVNLDVLQDTDAPLEIDREGWVQDYTVPEWLEGNTIYQEWKQNLNVTPRVQKIDRQDTLTILRPLGA